jgi:signal transduction histidine kinase
MSQWYSSQLSIAELDARKGSFPMAQVRDDASWETLARLVEDLGQLVVEQPVGESEAMQSLAAFFQADAAGLYIAAKPGQALDLVDGYQLPDGIPLQLGTGLLAQNFGRSPQIIQSRILDTGAGVWSQVARDSGWNQVVDYLLPYRTARLVLAFKGAVPRYVDEQVKAALRILTMAISYRQAHGQISVLNQRNEELSHLLMVGADHICEGVFVLDSDGKISSCNLVGGQLLGYSPGEIIGLTADGVLASRTDVSELVQRVISGQSPLETAQVVLYQRHGEPLSASLRIVSLRLPGCSGRFGAVVFLTERAAEQMEAVENDLREKNAELKRMISILAHEIRNPLGSVKAVLDYLKPVFAQDESTAQDLNTIQNEIRRMDRLLRDALLVARPTELKTEARQITELLDQLLAGREKLFEEQAIEVHLKYDHGLSPVRIDSIQMEQVFDNLILNAVHAMSTGGFLTIETSATTLENPAAPDGGAPAVKIKIGDSGPGIRSEVLDRIFDPFFTTKEGGTGLGLAVARRIVRQHDGTLDVESWPGIGTIFEVVLPIAKGFYE